MLNGRLETPRKDLKGDYKLWQVLFQESDYKSPAYPILHGFRCGGAKLEWDKNRQILVMRPRYGNGGPGDGAKWTGKKEYQEDRQKWLLGKYKKEVKKLIETAEEKAKERGLLPNKG